MSRRKGNGVRWKIIVPEALALRIELRYVDPTTGKPDYGARSRLITALLEEFDSVVSPLEKENPGITKRLLERLVAETKLEEQPS